MTNRHKPGTEPLFWVEEVIPYIPPTELRHAGCELCGHCALLRAFFRADRHLMDRTPAPRSTAGLEAEET